MGETFQKRISALLLSNRRHARWAAMVACMAVLVAFGVTVGLTQKGQAKTHEETVLDCQYSGGGAHTHDASCYDADGNLVCPLEEREYHVHDDSCYASETYLVCGLEEGEGAHAHDDSCYDEEGNLVCGLEESAGHVHTDECWQTDTWLACGKDEVTESHTHGNACFKTIVVDDGEEEPAAAEAEPVAEAEPEAEAEAEAAKDAEKPAAKATTATEPAKATTAENGEQTFAGVLKDADGNVVLSVAVKAPKGALPEGATMRVKPIDAVEVAGKVNEAVQAEAGEGKVAKSIMAVDIAFLDKDGVEVEPSEKVEVKITTALVRDVDAPALIHIDDKQDTAEVVHGTAKVNADDKDTTTGNEDTLKFDTDKFSPYIVVEIGDAEEQPAEAEPVIAMPAQSFEGKAGDVTVKVSAPEGAFAEGTTMSVEAVKADDVIESIEGAVTGDVKQVAAVDITFADAEGNQVQPLVPIKVTMTNAAAPAKSEPTVVHVDDEGEASVVEQSMITTAKDEVVFDADSFSVYAMVITTQYISASGEAYDVTVTYGPEAGIPEEAWLRVSEFEEGSAEWEAARKAVLADKLAKGEYVNLDDFGFAALDISIMVGDEEIEPEAEVQVDLKVKSLPEVEDLSEVAAELEVQHHVETADGIIVDTVVGGETESTFALATDEDTVAAKADEAVDPASFEESDFAAIAPETVEQAVETSFDTEVFSTFTITWRNGGRTVTVHYVDESGNELRIANPTDTYQNMTASSSSPAFLIYDIDGYEYSYTYRNNNNNRIVPLLSKNDNNRWRYTTSTALNSDASWTELSNGDNIYVVYKQKTAPTPGGTAVIDDATESDWPQGADKPQFSKSSVNNKVAGDKDGTNTISLSITGSEAPYERSTKANVIVVFDRSGSMGGDNIWRLNTAKAATNAMAKTLLDGDISGVKMALVTFSTSAVATQGLTDDYGTYTSAVNALTADGGTNWEKALNIANHMEVDSDAATYVVFVTDGDPTFRMSRGDATNYNIYNNVDGGRDIFANNDCSYYRNANVFGQGSSDARGRNFNYAV
ncbi:MAG: VWA domain-containing protein, partial [Atopobiaceae bacterium]|nr:VWA domain-containing protein [Atopobiaceae bacterium]